jgi:hypothetical protein
MRRIFKEYIKLSTLLITYALSMIWVYMFILMFINGGTVLIDCTTYGEDILEYPMMAILVPVLTYGTYLIYKEMSDDKSKLCKTEKTRP